MGVVFAARDTTLGRDVAIKTLLLDRVDADLARRFAEEARITARLPHPAIPPVHALGTLPDGRPFLAMKLVHGRTLAESLRDRPPAADLPQLVGIFEAICQAVGFAHSQGVIHRDLKPSNVMVGAFGEVQVMDWGIAKAYRLADAEGPGAAFGPAGGSDRAGTPAYVAPEQARGDAVGPRADVFALGVILCAILTCDPTLPHAHAVLGYALLNTGDTPGARAAFTEAGLLNPQFKLLLAKLPPAPVAPPPREVRP
jgi:serine/threonine protein kinase